MFGDVAADEAGVGPLLLQLVCQRQATHEMTCANCDGRINTQSDAFHLMLPYSLAAA